MSLQQEHYEIMVDVDDGDYNGGMTTGGNVFSDRFNVRIDDQSTVKLKSSVTRRKGRGFSSAEDQHGLPTISHFDTLKEEYSGRAQRSVEGWVLFVTGLHEEATEDDLYDRFADYGPVKDLKINLDHRTGYVKGYALVEFGEYEHARRTQEELNGSEFMDGILHVDFAFVKPPS